MQFERAHPDRAARLGGAAYACLDDPMGKRNRFKEAKRQNAQSALSAVLRTHSRRHDRVGAVV
jgi:hypothetical protein